MINTRLRSFIFIVGSIKIFISYYTKVSEISSFQGKCNSEFTMIYISAAVGFSYCCKMYVHRRRRVCDGNTVKLR